jgi:hypothetical protein
MFLADISADTDILGQRYRPPIPIPIFYISRYLADNRSKGRYKPICWPISRIFNRYLADTDIADIYLADTDMPIPICRYRYPVYRYRYIGIGQIYRETDISVYPYKHASIFFRHSLKNSQIFFPKANGHCRHFPLKLNKFFTKKTCFHIAISVLS